MHSFNSRLETPMGPLTFYFNMPQSGGRMHCHVSTVLKTGKLVLFGMYPLAGIWRIDKAAAVPSFIHHLDFVLSETIIAALGQQRSAAPAMV